MLPCETIAVSFVDLANPNHPHAAALPPAPPHHHHHHQAAVTCHRLKERAELKDPTAALAATEQRATVFYLDHTADYSLIDVGFLIGLVAKTFGPDAALPPLDNDSRVRLRWRYPTLAESVVTTHRVIRDIPFHVILRQDDWTGPLQRLWARHERQPPSVVDLTSTSITTDDADAGHVVAGDGSHWDDEDQRRLRAASESEDDSARSHSSRSCASSRSSCSSPCPSARADREFHTFTPPAARRAPSLLREGQHRGNTHTFRAENCPGAASFFGDEEEHGFQMVKAEPLVTPSLKRSADKGYYWQWSREKEWWFHYNEDGSATPLPPPTSVGCI